MNRHELQKIEKFSRDVLLNVANPSHDWEHIQRVVKNARWILKKLNIKNIDLNLITAACYLHDIPVVLYARGPFGLIVGHYFEPKAIEVELPKILDKFSLSDEERKIIYMAVYNHPGSEGGRLNRDGDIYSKVLQDADTYDVASDARIVGYKKSRAIFYSWAVPLIYGLYTRYRRENIARCLNFPELAKELTY